MHERKKLTLKIWEMNCVGKAAFGALKAKGVMKQVTFGDFPFVPFLMFAHKYRN